MNVTETITSLADRVRGSLGDENDESESNDESTMNGDESEPDDAESELTDDESDGWSVAETPTTKVLHDVAQTADGPYAVGAEGNVLRRGEEGWELQIDAGPATKHNTLTAIDTTDDGKRVWFAGSSGALGMFDIETGRKYDYSAPEERTSTWEAIAVVGEDGTERLRVANGSGEVFPVTIDEDGCPQYGEPVKPGSGSTIPALDFGGETAYAIDTSGNVFAETDGEWVDIGIRNAQVNFFDLYADEDALLIAGGDGRVYRYDRACENWTPVEAGSATLYGIDRADGETVAVGASGRVYRRGSRDGWTDTDSPVEEDLRAVVLGEPDVAVGAGSVVIER